MPEAIDEAFARQFLEQVAPPLDGSKHKGEGGRVGILGGSSDYTGAPFYAGMSALRTGAELVYVFCAQEAALPLKGYSPELMVTPVYSGEGDANEILRAVEQVLPRLHALVVGCGMGRKAEVLRGAAEVVKAAMRAGIPVVIDADGLQMVCQYPEALAGENAHRVLLTPNVIEFQRLCDARGVDLPKPPGATPEKLEELSEKLGGVAVCLKGKEDTVAMTRALGWPSRCCAEQGTPRRSGGLGDLFAGSLGALLAWLRPEARGVGRGSWHITDAALAGSLLVRRSCRRAFEQRKRAMTAPDVLEFIGGVFEELCPAEGLRPKASS